MPEALANFRGAVLCRRAARAPGLTLSGVTAEHPGEATSLAFSLAAPADCPGTLEDALVEHAGSAQYRIRSGPGEWLVSATVVHLHREIAERFYRAIPPRPAPWRKRLFWRAVLALAASPAGLLVLRALRR